MKSQFLALFLSAICFSANAQNFIQIPTEFPAQAYKAIKPVNVGYTLYFSNYFEPSDDKFEATPNKNGLYVDASVDLGNNKPSSLDNAVFTVDADKLINELKINTAEVASKFKGLKKKQHYMCELSGKMNSKLEVHYEGGDTLRFPSTQLWAKLSSPTAVGKSTISCQHIKD